MRKPNTNDQEINEQEQQGSLFLENAVQMSQDTCLVYLSTHELEAGWYRFGGEGHLVEISCVELNKQNTTLLRQTIEKQFALITPAVWGSNRLSYRYPINLQKGDTKKYEQEELDSNNQFVLVSGNYLYKSAYAFSLSFRRFVIMPNFINLKCFSRGRYAVPAGTVYVLQEPLGKAWKNWDESWFPKEGPSLKRWGCGLAFTFVKITQLI